MRQIAVLLCMRLLLLILADVVVDGVGKLEVPVEIAAIRIVGVGQDRKLLLRLPFKQAIALGWIVISSFYLAEHGPSVGFQEVRVTQEPGEYFLMGHEVSRDHANTRRP